MLELPVIDELFAERRQKDMIAFLAARFQTVPADIQDRIRSVQDEERLDELVKLAATCTDLESFSAGLDHERPTAS